MKKTIAIILVAILSLLPLVGCGGDRCSEDRVIEPAATPQYTIIEIDGHEYIWAWRHSGYAGGGGLCHKEDCKSPDHVTE